MKDEWCRLKFSGTEKTFDSCPFCIILADFQIDDANGWRADIIIICMPVNDPAKIGFFSIFETTVGHQS